MHEFPAKHLFDFLNCYGISQGNFSTNIVSSRTLQKGDWGKWKWSAVGHVMKYVLP